MMNGHWTSISGVDIFYGVTDIDLVMMMQDGDSICTSDCYGDHSSDSKSENNEDSDGGGGSEDDGGW